jgi:TrmH family RNA methyltransferase
VTHAEPFALGPRHHEVKRLRALLRDPGARTEARAFVLEGPRLVADALRRGAEIDAIYLGTNARTAFASLLAHPNAADVPVAELKEGVLEKLGTTRTPQPVLAVVPMPEPVTITDLDGPGPVIVVVDVADPGNLGTLLRSAEAAGCAGVVGAGATVDPYNPKVVRASAGSVLAVRIVDDRSDERAADPVTTLAVLGATGRRRLGATTDGPPAATVDLRGRVALVLGNEARGLDDALRAELDGTIAVPMEGSAESLNVAMAGTVLAFEAARQRAAS